MPPQLDEQKLCLCDVGGVSHIPDRAICVVSPLTEPDLDCGPFPADSELMGGISEETMMAAVLARLVASHPESPTDDVAGCMRRAQDRFESSPIREFVPLLVERRARAELDRPVTPV